MGENPFWAPGAGFVAKQLDPLYCRTVAICLGWCTHPVYPVSRIYFNHDLCAISPEVARSYCEVNSALMRIDSCTPLSVTGSCACCPAAAQWRLGWGFAERLCACACVCLKKISKVLFTASQLHKYPSGNVSNRQPFFSFNRAGNKQK